MSNGVIYIESDMYEDALRLLEIYAAHSASAVSNAFLHSMVNIKNDELKRTYDELRKTYLDTIEALRLTVDAKDEYTRGHSDRVAYFACKVGKAIGLTDAELETLRIGGIFHDIRKIGTSDEILKKTDMLSGRSMTLSSSTLSRARISFRPYPCLRTPCRLSSAIMNG